MYNKLNCGLEKCVLNSTDNFFIQFQGTGPGNFAQPSTYEHGGQPNSGEMFFRIWYCTCKFL